MSFAALHSSKKWFPQWQTIDAEEAFVNRIGRSSLHFWLPGMPVTDQTVRLLICAAWWSLPDLELLDEVESMLNALNHVERPHIHIDVVNYDEVTDPIAAAQCFPNWKVLATPVVGLWEHGVYNRAEVGGELARTVLRWRRVGDWQPVTGRIPCRRMKGR